MVSGDLKYDDRFNSTAIHVLHEASKGNIATLFEGGSLVAIHSKRVTFMPKECCLIRQLRGETEDINTRKNKTNLSQGIDDFTGKTLNDEVVKTREKYLLEQSQQSNSD